MSKKRILLTGGKGFFCSRLADYYKNDYEFLVTDKDDLDFTDRQAVLDCASAFQPNLIIHAGAIAVTDFCNQHPDIARKVNVDGALHVAEAARKAHAQLIFLSSEQVFNGNTNGGLNL